MVKVHFYAFLLVLSFCFNSYAMKSDADTITNPCKQSGSFNQSGELPRVESDEQTVPPTIAPDLDDETIEVIPAQLPNRITYLINKRPKLVVEAVVCGVSTAVGFGAAYYMLKNNMSPISGSGCFATAGALGAVSSGYKLVQEIRK